MPNKETRRDFLKLAGSLSAGLMLGATGRSASANPNSNSPNPTGASAAALTAGPLGTVRIAMIGVGNPPNSPTSHEAAGNQPHLWRSSRKPSIALMPN